MVFLHWERESAKCLERGVRAQEGKQNIHAEEKVVTEMGDWELRGTDHSVNLLNGFLSVGEGLYKIRKKEH